MNKKTSSFTGRHIRLNCTTSTLFSSQYYHFDQTSVHYSTPYPTHPDDHSEQASIQLSGNPISTRNAPTSRFEPLMISRWHQTTTNAVLLASKGWQAGRQAVTHKRDEVEHGGRLYVWPHADLEHVGADRLRLAMARSHRYEATEHLRTFSIFRVATTKEGQPTGKTQKHGEHEKHEKLHTISEKLSDGLSSFIEFHP